MNNNPLPKSCERCVDREKHGLPSMRTGMNDNWFEEIKDDVEKTTSDGTIEKLNLKIWDFRFSNNCNLSCRTCGPLFSSKWSSDHFKLGIDHQQTGLIDLHDASLFWESVEKNIKTVKEISFAGGEPMVMSEHWKMLELFEKYSYYDVTLNYSINATKLSYRDKNVLDFWGKFKKVHLSLSIDGVEDTFNYIRNNGKWEEVKKNLLTLHENNIDYWVHPTISILNIFRITELHKTLFDMGIIPIERKKNEKSYDPIDYFSKRFHLNPLYVPDYYSIRTLPHELKVLATGKIKEYGNEMNLKYKIPMNGWESLIDFLWEEDNSDKFGEFVSMTNRLDKIRKQSFLQINPEFKNYFNI
jgi:sulfatase maturation enzyme AslB (radical SAM superfamily)